MKTRIGTRLLAAALFLLLAGSAFAAGSSVTWTRAIANSGMKPVLRTYTAAIVSDDAAGTASGAVTMHGYVVAIDTDPGSTAPSDNWGCTLIGPRGGDALGGAIAANRDTANSERAYPLDPGGSTVFARVDGSYTLTCAAMGNSKVATVVLSVQE